MFLESFTCRCPTLLRSFAHQADCQKHTLCRDAKKSVFDWDASSCSIALTFLLSLEGNGSSHARMPASLHRPQVWSATSTSPCWS